MDKFLQEIYDECKQEVSLFKNLPYPDDLIFSTQQSFGGKFRFRNQKQVGKNNWTCISTILISGRYFAAYGRAEIKEVMKHEMLHFYEFKFFGETDHGRLFQYLCLCYGIILYSKAWQEIEISQVKEAIVKTKREDFGDEV